MLCIYSDVDIWPLVVLMSLFKCMLFSRKYDGNMVVFVHCILDLLRDLSRKLWNQKKETDPLLIQRGAFNKYVYAFVENSIPVPRTRTGRQS